MNDVYDVTADRGRAILAGSNAAAAMLVRHVVETRRQSDLLANAGDDDQVVQALHLQREDLLLLRSGKRFELFQAGQWSHASSLHPPRKSA